MRRGAVWGSLRPGAQSATAQTNSNVAGKQLGKESQKEHNNPLPSNLGVADKKEEMQPLPVVLKKKGITRVGRK